MAQGLRVVEDLAVETGGVQIDQRLPGHERSNGRLTAGSPWTAFFNRINATAAREGGYMPFLIFGQEPEEMVVRTYGRLRNYNPVPVRVGACGAGWHTRNLPIDRIIGGPAFRNPDTDCLLQVAGLAAHALLWREEPGAGVDSGAMSGAFAVLDRALNRRASRHDAQGVVRR